MGFLDTLFKSVQNVFGGLGNAASGAMGAVTNAGSKIGQGIASKGGQSVMSSFAPKAIQGTMGNAGSGGMKTGASQIAKGGFNSMFNQANHADYAPQLPPAGFSGGADATPASKSGFNLMDLFKGGAGKMAGGLGMMGLGQVLGGSPKMPSFQTDAMNNYQNYNTGKLPPNVEDMINRTAQINEDQATKQLRDVYKNARPGTDYTTDSAYQRDLANLQRTQTLNRADAQAQALMGFNEQELSRASELAQLSIAEIMAKTGMESEEAASIKQMFGNVGGMMIANGLGLDQYGFGGE